MNKIRKWFEIGRELFCSLLFPPRCPVCDEILIPEETNNGIHLACENKLYPVEGAVCMHCGRPLGKIKSHKNQTVEKKEEDVSQVYLSIENAYEYCMECRRKGYVSKIVSDNQNYGVRKDSSAVTQAKSIYLYRGVIKKSMYRFKYANKREYAHFFARQAVRRSGDWMRNHCIEAIIPVPMYLPKQKQRGYNQAETFAMELSKLTGIPVVKDCIYRTKDTTPQKELNHQDRKNNLENAFQKGESIVQYSHILVVDDIYTTGCTAEAVADVMRKQGCHRVYLLSICIGGND